MISRPLFAALAAAGCAAAAWAAPPILSPTGFPGWQTRNVAFPFVLADRAAGGYRMFYAGSPAGRVNASTWERWVTLTATSRDGLKWRFPDDYAPVVHAHVFAEGEVADPAALAARFDSVAAFGASVVRDAAGFTMWYTGWNGSHVAAEAGGRDVGHAIGRATSPDGAAWTKQPGDAGGGAVLAPGPPGEPDAQGAGQPFVVREGGAYRMWYECSDGARWRICAATSADGRGWSKAGVALDLGPEGAPDALGLRNPVVFRRGAEYELWYQGEGPGRPRFRVLRARARDGRTWRRDGEVALHPDDAVDGDERIHVDSVVPLPDGRLRAYYAKETPGRVSAYGPTIASGYHIHAEIVK